jgi:hypothetical protein
LVDVETYDDLQRQLEILRGIARGERAVEDGRTLPHAEPKKRMGRWLQVVSTEPALTDLDAIGDYIALDYREAARRLAQKVLNISKNWNVIPRADPCQPSSGGLVTDKLSGRPAGF